ncbi:hypothetical protein [Methanofollis tationis]|uniref:Uncharacterized protein n=1 Tax=Methanofollis tationis TaxID=81417 RepID=A0A7K4HNP1_9EURY|nr:hypothetical protein [Methanofollis tationis]NVO66849.1 hypothetical protein [Methanofollis tationis]
MKKWFYFALIAVFFLFQTAAAASNGSAEIETDTFGASVDLTVAGSIADWSLTVGENEDVGSITMTVLSNNAGGYDVKVYDARDGGKPAETAGHLTKYESSYLGAYLKNPLQIKSGTGAYVSLSGVQQSIESKVGISDDAGDQYAIGIKQRLEPSDTLLSEGQSYRIVVTFVASAL